jgi:hypothetical protein
MIRKIQKNFFIFIILFLHLFLCEALDVAKLSSSLTSKYGSVYEGQK